MSGHLEGTQEPNPMKKLTPTLLFISWLGMICLSTYPLNATPFSPKQDTLILKAQKHQGYGLYETGGSWSLHLEEISDEDTRMQVIPSGIENPKIGKEIIDFKAYTYQGIEKDNLEAIEGFLEKSYPAKIDTAQLPSEEVNTVKVVYGMQEGVEVYIVDENNNQDFRDDSVRVLEEMYVDGVMPKPVKFHYQIYNGQALVPDSSWAIIGRNSRGQLAFSSAQYLTTTFSLDHQEYELQIINWAPFFRFCFESPFIGITAHNGVRKDSLLTSEKLALGEYLQLGNSYYQFVDVSNDGKEITLVKEEEVSDIIGTQVGFIAPDFQGVTIDGDSVSLADYENEYLLLTNTTGCYSEPMSYVSYKELSDQYYSQLDMLVLDKSPGALNANIKSLGLKGKFILAEENPSVEKNYREDFCSRLCFLIDPSGHILDKFQLYDWEHTLAQHFK